MLPQRAIRRTNEEGKTHDQGQWCAFPRMTRTGKNEMCAIACSIQTLWIRSRLIFTRPQARSMVAIKLRSRYGPLALKVGSFAGSMLGLKVHPLFTHMAEKNPLEWKTRR